MAICKICGTVDKTLPHSWVNWECPDCERDLHRTQSDRGGDAIDECHDVEILERLKECPDGFQPCGPTG